MEAIGLDVVKKQIEYYSMPNGRIPFLEWFQTLKENHVRAVVDNRLNRVRAGNLGNCEAVGLGVFELKIHLGPGHRIYFSQIGHQVVLLLTGGDKASQRKDIAKAQEYWAEYQGRPYEIV